MAKLLYIMIGMPSAYNSGIEFCERLATGGFNVTLACNEDISALSAVGQYNFTWLKADHELRTMTRKYRDSIDTSFKWTRRLKMFKKLRQLRRESLRSVEIEQLLTSVEPDLLVIDIECHKAIIQSRKSNIPTILCSRWFSITRQPNIPPLHSTLTPEDGVLSGLRTWQQWATLLLTKRIIRLRQRLSLKRFSPVTYRNIVHADLTQLAKHNDIEPNSLFEKHGWLIPHHYKNIPITSMVPQELDFKNAVSSNTYLGPIVPKHNHAFCIASEVLQELESFIQLSRQANRSIIYFSLGTYLKADTQLVDILNRIVSKRSDLALIVGLGGLPIPADNTTNNDKVLYLQSAPQIDILKVTDLAVLHGGIGSLTEALIHAVPMIVFSVHTNDQNGCAARIKHHNLGYVLDICNIEDNFLENRIDALLGDKALRNKVIDFSELLQKYQQPNETLERFLSVCPEKIVQAIQQTKPLKFDREYLS